jgi:prepilin-type N-terminal cleavage/methylation domain-containing protein
MFPTRQKPASLLARRCAGFSLPELLTVIAVIGTLSGISIQSYSNVQSAARESVAFDSVAILNRALLHFDQTNWDIVLDPVADATSDELAVLRTLQWRNPDPTLATPGSPYLPSTFNDAMSSSAGEYRIRWNGHVFELLAPGMPGAGILASNTPGATVATYPSDYQPLGPSQHE